MIPEGWARRQIGELVTNIGDGGTPRRDNPSYFGGDVPWVVIQDIKPLITVTKNTLTKEGLDACSAKLWPKNAVILSTGATIGEVGIAGVPLATKQGITGMVCEEYVIPKFLYYLLQQKKQCLQTLAQGSTIREVRPPILKKIDINLPPKFEQKKIAAILSSVDDTIQATQAVIDQTRTVKQGLMQQLLTRGIGHTRFKQTEIGEIPETWEFTTLGKIANDKGLQTGPFGSQLHASEYIESGIPVVMPKDIFDGRILDDNIACVPEDVADRLMKHRLQAGDILFARRGDIGRCSLVRSSEVGWICGTGCLRARVNDKISPEFLIQFLQWPETVKWLNENAVGQTMLNLNTQILANLPILVPPKHEQINITNIFESINDELDKLISEKSTLLSIKHGLMQDLLTGRIRVGGST